MSDPIRLLHGAKENMPIEDISSVGSIFVTHEGEIYFDFLIDGEIKRIQIKDQDLINTVNELDSFTKEQIEAIKIENIKDGAGANSLIQNDGVSISENISLDFTNGDTSNWEVVNGDYSISDAGLTINLPNPDSRFEMNITLDIPKELIYMRGYMSGSADNTAFDFSINGNTYTINEDILAGTTWIDSSVMLVNGVNKIIIVPAVNATITLTSLLFTGKQSNATGAGSVAFGRYNKVSGNYATALNYENTVESNYGFAAGISNIVIGDTGMALGASNAARGAYSFAKGQGTQAHGHYSDTSGQGTKTWGYWSTAKGYKSEASAECSYAQGLESKAIGRYTHAQGSYTKAYSNACHTQGYKTEAGISGSDGKDIYASHAQGYETKAPGKYAHSRNYKTIASGEASTAGGKGTHAIGDSQTVIGKYNLERTNALFQVGNGDSDAVRSNAFEVLQNGSIIMGGRVYDPVILSDLISYNEVTTLIENAITTALNTAV